MRKSEGKNLLNTEPMQNSLINRFLDYTDYRESQ